MAGEWQTTGGQYCIDKCQYHDDEYYFYWCHVSDPAQVYSDGTDKEVHGSFSMGQYLVKKHQVTKIGTFCPLFCVRIFDKSDCTTVLELGLSVASFELNRTIC